MPASKERRRAIFVAEVLAVIFMGAVAAAARRSGVSLLLFPELAALSHDVLTRPRGKWASQPLRMILTPVLAGVAGIFIARRAHYGAVAVLLIVLASLLIIRVLRASIAPALSAGLLPMVMGERHWMYPAAIFAGLAGLALLLWVWRLYGPLLAAAQPEKSIDDALEANSTDRFWLVTLIAFVALLASVGQLTGLHFILFPPLVVMAYEILGHPELPGWMERPVLFPVVCFLTASVGLLACREFHGDAAGVVVTVALSILMLRIFRMHMPPALAVGLLPFVMTAPNAWYPGSVAIGTTALLLWSVGRGWLAKSLADTRESANASSS